MKKLEAANNKATVASAQYEKEKTRCKKVDEELQKTSKVSSLVQLYTINI